MRRIIHKVTVVTDSHYVYDLLATNETLLKEWGSHEKESTFEYNGPGLSYQANPDILYPTTRSYYRLTTEMNVTVSLSRANLFSSNQATSRLGDQARLAATLMYDHV